MVKTSIFYQQYANIKKIQFLLLLFYNCLLSFMMFKTETKIIVDLMAPLNIVVAKLEVEGATRAGDVVPFKNLQPSKESTVFPDWNMVFHIGWN